MGEARQGWPVSKCQTGTPVLGVERGEGAAIFAEEDEASGGGERAAAAIAFGQGIVPGLGAGVEVDGADEVLAAAASAESVAAEEALAQLGGCGVLAVGVAAFGDARDVQVRRRIEGRREPLCGAGRAGLRSLERGLEVVGQDGAAVGAVAGGPVLCAEGRGEEQLAVGAIEDEEEAVVIGVRQQLARTGPARAGRGE
jgi:hypothetical protein